MKLLILLGLVFFLAAACGKKEQQKLPEQADSLAVAADSAKSVFNENAPEWFNQPPARDGFIYAAAEGRSQRANIAESKALLRARAKLADQLEEHRLSETEKTSAAGADEEHGNTETHHVVLQKSRIKYKKQLKTGKQWHVFVLMELPLNQN